MNSQEEIENEKKNNLNPDIPCVSQEGWTALAHTKYLYVQNDSHGSPVIGRVTITRSLPVRAYKLHHNITQTDGISSPRGIMLSS